MNKISTEKEYMADMMFAKGSSIREVCESVGIAKETAHRIQKKGREYDLTKSGSTRVNTGRRADGSMSFYLTGEFREHWYPPIQSEPKRSREEL